MGLVRVERRIGEVYFFKPAKEQLKEEVEAYIIEVLEFEPLRDGGKYEPKDTIWANVVAVLSDGSTEDYGKTAFSNGGLVGPLKDIVGETTVFTLGQYTNKKDQEVWCWNDSPDTAWKVAEEYVAALDAAADDAPGFEDE